VCCFQENEYFSLSNSNKIALSAYHCVLMFLLNGLKDVFYIHCSETRMSRSFWDVCIKNVQISKKKEGTSSFCVFVYYDNLNVPKYLTPFRDLFPVTLVYGNMDVRGGE